MQRVQGLIIGGGPSGLSAAYSLQGDTIVLESERTVGGLCRSITHGGGVFDIGGHSFHTPHTEVADLIDSLVKGGIDSQRRDARVYTNGALIPYPFQKFFNRIPDAEVVRSCEDGLNNTAGNAGDAKNFQDYIIRKFGHGIAEHFMLPYNRKLWARDLTKVSCEWTSERVAASKLENEKFDTKGDKRTPLQADTMVGYPNTGGFQEISQSFVPYLPGLQLGTRVVQIDVKNHAAITEAGKRFEWEFLVSTVPLPILLRMIDQTPREILSCADRLEFLSLRVELLLVGHPLNTPIQRIYVADPRIPAHKIALNHNSSDALRSQPCHAITSEVSVSRQKPVDVDAIAPSTISLLTDLGILDSAEDITWRSHVDVKYAYPVYTHDRPGLVATIQKWLQQYHIYTVGRFGSWEYINSDKCIMKGLTLGRDLRSRYPLQPAATVNRGGY